MANEHGRKTKATFDLSALVARYGRRTRVSGPCRSHVQVTRKHGQGIAGHAYALAKEPHVRACCTAVLGQFLAVPRHAGQALDLDPAPEVVELVVG